MKGIVRHHLLEIILVPQEDGTFKTILNSADRLKELGVYDDWKLTIQMSRAEHAGLHNITRTEEDLYSFTHSQSGKTGYWKGKPMSEEHRRKMGQSRKGHLTSEETRRKIGEANSKALKGRTLSEETRRKIRESVKAALAKKKAFKQGEMKWQV